MKYTEIMVRYGELSTKGKNRTRFIQKLADNIRESLVQFPNIKILADRDRTRLLLNEEDCESVIFELKKIFGIVNFSPVVRVDKDLDKMKKQAQEMIADQYVQGLTFKITVKRQDHDFEMDTNELNRWLGAAVFEKFSEIKAQMKKPDINLKVEVRNNGVYFSTKIIQGAGGLPVGVSGRGMLMLSGGIDSPVAGYLAMKRGMEIEAVYFASPPYTSEAALQKAKDLAQKLTSFGGKIQFIEVPFTEVQEEIKATIPSAYWMTVTRRMMMRITERLRGIRQGLLIITGESLGQVASQTPNSLIAIEEVVSTPVIRPVITMDKNEIIEVAEKIDTFQLSIQPFEDCCTIFAPKAPKTKPDLAKVREYEQRLNVEVLVERAVSRMIVTKVTSKGKEDPTEEFIDLL
ncbi:MAG: tRNA 4-thiouridine(8) synthase ThiI [Lactobacillales bacterium]|jgi:thiamine biosynthesis protein ThiI|nr:tRNA 4-thiouridine(8) synthase ThiI [Lactobacillales bacterium]